MTTTEKTTETKRLEVAVASAKAQLLVTTGLAAKLAQVAVCLDLQAKLETVQRMPAFD